MSYIALYRKYRPKRFEDVIGQDIIVNILKNSIINNKIGHAYIFSGTKGTGKTSVAKIFAKAINCLKNTNGDLCNECDFCINHAESTSDIIEIDAASNNGIDEIREIRNSVQILPTVSRYKVYIIDEVHMLSQSAFNALLKTLEEPPKHAVFILATTDLYKVPSTVISRCQKMDFKKISNKNIKNHLENILKKENKCLQNDVLDLITTLSDGSFRDAINLLDQVLMLDDESQNVGNINSMFGILSDVQIIKLFDYIYNSNIKEGLNFINDITNDGINLINVSRKLLELITNIIIYNNTSDYFSINYSEMLSKYIFYDMDKLYNAAKVINTLIKSLQNTENNKNTFIIHFIELCSIFKKQDILNVNNTATDIYKSIDINNSDNRNLKKNNNEIDFFQKNKDILINNALATASKEEKKKFITILNEKLDNYVTNINYTSIYGLIKNGIAMVVGPKDVIFTFKKDFDSVLFNKNIILVSKLLNEIFESKYNCIAVNNDEWKNILNKYTNDIKNGIIYTYKEIEIDYKTKKSTKLENDVENIFGEDIVSKE